MGLLFSGRPFSDIENDCFRRAIPGLSHREGLTQKCSDFTKSTVVDLKEKLKGCEFLSIQFGIWGDRAKRRFSG
jgi:SET domain-containing protein